MLTELTNFVSAFYVIFSFSFLVALTGAMAPGPLLTYTIIKTIKTKKRGYLMGLWVIVGHAILEMGIIIFLLFGFSFVLENVIVIRTIGVVGGVILVYFGVSIIRSVYLGKITTSFLNPSEEQSEGSEPFKNKGLENAVVGGIIVSMANPYWWVWWATVGFALMVHLNVSFKQWPELLAFFVGHEAGDLIWYLVVSFLTFFGLRHLNKKVYYGVLICCGALMILFGIYLGCFPFFKA